MGFEKSNGRSPVAQDFIWMAEYNDGKYFSEFDYNTKEKNDFYLIQKHKLSTFGLIGNGFKLRFDVTTGSFFVNNTSINISYVIDGVEHMLTGLFRGLNAFNDIISYKNAYSDADLKDSSGVFSSHIEQYNFGYKKQLIINDVNIRFQAIMCIPNNSPAYIEFKLVSDKDLDGTLRIKRAGGFLQEIDAPLKANIAGICEWTLS